MTSHAFKRPHEVDPRDAMGPGEPTENPLEEFARLMGADVRALQDFDNAANLAPTSEASPEAATFEAGATTERQEGEAHVDAFDAAQPIDFDDYEEPPAELAMPPRRLGAVTLGVLVAVAVAGSVGVWAFKGAPGPATSAGGIAAKQPSRAAPTALVATEPTAAAPGPTAAAQPTAPPLASAAPPATRSIALASPSEAAPVPAATVDSAIVPPTAPLQPKPVKSVAVRTDGSVILSDGGAAAAADRSPVALNAPPAAAPTDAAPALRDPPTPVARPVDAAANGAPKPTKQKPDALAKPSPKSVDREVVARIDAAAPDPDAPPAVPVAAAPSGGGLSADSVLQFVPNLYEKAASALRGPSPQAPAAATEPSAPPSGAGFSAEPLLQFVPNLYEKATSALRNSPPAAEVARADPKPVAASGASAYAAQLATASTESAGLTAAARLRSRFPGELGALQPTVRQAEVDGRKIYQVRVDGMSKTEAASLCLKLRTSGCSVAKD